MSIHILSEIGSLVGEDDEEEDDVDFGFAFATDLSALVREYSTILDSCPVLAEESSFHMEFVLSLSDLSWICYFRSKFWSTIEI